MNATQNTGNSVFMNSEQRAVIGSLIEAERRHLTAWWTCLSELRRRKELPDWVMSMPVGREEDWDRWCDDRKAVNKFLFGSDAIVLGSTQDRIEAQRTGVWHKEVTL